MTVISRKKNICRMMDIIMNERKGGKMTEKEIKTLEAKIEELRRQYNEVVMQRNSMESDLVTLQKENERLVAIIENLSEGIARIARR